MKTYLIISWIIISTSLISYMHSADNSKDLPIPRIIITPPSSTETDPTPPIQQHTDRLSSSKNTRRSSAPKYLASPLSNTVKLNTQSIRTIKPSDIEYDTFYEIIFQSTTYKMRYILHNLTVIFIYHGNNREINSNFVKFENSIDAQSWIIQQIKPSSLHRCCTQ